jgi:RNA polymerase sigma factor (sigma-70 family)
VNERSDQELLRDYAERRSEAAFSELVRRHVDLVYSAALRMVWRSHLAQDVTQKTFVALAQNARQLTNRPVLSGWLHRTAQNLAGKTVRTDVRRRAREQEAAVMNELLAESGTDVPPDWREIAPHLDAALGELSEPDRDALMLRYFERKSAREMAQALGISDEAAQKRVNRAVERLRELFAKRGITVGASGLVLAISANAVQAAPLGIVATITAASAVSGAAACISASTATKAIAMTTLQKTLAATAIAVFAGAGIYEAHEAAQLRSQVQTLRQQQAPLAEQIQQLQRERDDATNRVLDLFAENTRLRTNPNDSELLKLRSEVARLQRDSKELNELKYSQLPIDTNSIEVAANLWVSRAAILKNWIEQHPEERIPEFQYLRDCDWLDAVRHSNMQGPYASGNEAPDLRDRAKEQFAHLMENALRRFVEEHNGDLPSEISQIIPYFSEPVSVEILGSYQLLHTGKLADVPPKSSIVADVSPPHGKNDWRRMMIRTDDWVWTRRDQ